MTLKGIAFDLEGTVIDVESAHHDAFLNVCAEIGHPMSFSEALEKVPGFIGGGDIIISAGLNKLPGVSLSVEELVVRKMEHYEHLLQKMSVAPRKGFREVLAELRRLGLDISIGSLTPSKQAQVLLARSGVGELIEDSKIVLREHVKNVKPAPDVFLETARRMGIGPECQLVFEDSPRGVQAAIAANSKVVGMPVYTMPAAQHALVDAGVSRIFWDWREINVSALVNNLS